MKFLLCILLAAGILSVPDINAAQLEISWANPSSYRDINPAEQSRKKFEMRVQSELTTLFSSLAEQLPSDNLLRLNINDVDLAGEVTWVRGANVRVIKRHYIPSILLSYELLTNEGDMKKKQAKIKIQDMTFMAGITQPSRNTFLYYEERMIVAWFDETFNTYFDN